MTVSLSARPICKRNRMDIMPADEWPIGDIGRPNLGRRYGAIHTPPPPETTIEFLARINQYTFLPRLPIVRCLNCLHSSEIIVESKLQYVCAIMFNVQVDAHGGCLRGELPEG